MSEEIIGIARFKFHPGKVEDFKRLSAICMEIVKAKDTGTLEYSTFFNTDETEAIVIERYKDSQSLIEHGQHMAEMMEPILATATVYGEILGDASPELRANLSPDGPVQLFVPWVRM